MSTLAVNTITNAAGGNTAQINGMTPTAQSLQGFRNRIINGNMVIDQRNAGAAVTPTDGAYTLDRWKNFRSGGGAYTVQRATEVPNTTFSNSAVLTVTTADASIASTDYYAFNQDVEGFNAADLGWGTATAQAITLSFWIRSSVTGTWVAALCNTDGSRAYPATFTVSAANTWQYVTLTVPGETTGTWGKTNNVGLTLRFDLGTGSNGNGTANVWNTAGAFAGVRTSSSVNWIATLGATFYITGVQLEAGSVATPFERIDYGRQLQLCMRYFEKTYNIAAAPGTSTTEGRITAGGESQASPTTAGYLIGGRSWMVRKRATPTVVLYDNVGNAGKVSVGVWGVSNSNNNDAYVSDSSETSSFMGRTGAFGTRDSANTAQFHYTASAEL
jgi:hypothetical protein